MIQRVPVIFAQFQQGSTATVLARLAQLATSPFQPGVPYLPGDVASIVCCVYSAGQPVAGWNGITINPSDVISTSLAGWPLDAVGYNFQHSVGPEGIPAGNVQAEVVYTLVMADASVWSFKATGPAEAVP